ncbi:MAG: hypothetical protein ICV72_07120 [Aldersonia sp.]|nr:hypothetical protein [Aldersonia sp.]
MPVAEDELHATARAAARGDAAALRNLADYAWPPVVRYCRALMGGGTVGTDVAGQVFPEVVSCYRSDRDGGAPFLGYLCRSVGAALDRRPDRVSPPTTPMAVAVAALGPTAGHVLWLRTVEHLSVADTADALGLRIGEVRMWQHRALASIRRHIGSPAQARAGTG